MVGGIIGLIATVYLKPRRNRFNEDSVHQMSSPTNALLGKIHTIVLLINNQEPFYSGGAGSASMPDPSGESRMDGGG